MLGASLIAVGCLAVLAGLWLAWPPLALLALGVAAVAVGASLVVEVD